MENVVITGAGQAGFSVASELRKLGFEGTISLIGKECHAPYQRPPLSKDYLLGKIPKDRLLIRPTPYYAEQNISLLLDESVTGIDTQSRVASFESGGSLQYDALVLVTGAIPRRLAATIGGNLEGVHYIRNLVDIDGLAPAINAGNKMAIIGGGYIGLEAAAVAAQKGMKITVIEAADRILNRVACKQTSDFIRDLHIEHGVNILDGQAVKSLRGASGKVTDVVLENGNIIATDIVIVGIGVEPETSIAESAGITLVNGIRTDEYGKTDIPGIWAAGDCASFPWNGGLVRLESVPNAIDHGQTIARNLMGQNEKYIPKPWFWSDQYDLKLQIAGWNNAYDDVVIRNNGAKRSHWYFSGQKLVTVDSFNDPASHMIARRLLTSGKPVSKTRIADPKTELKTIL